VTSEAGSGRPTADVTPEASGAQSPGTKKRVPKRFRNL
jgi:hypothetical protein